VKFNVEISPAVAAEAYAAFEDIASRSQAQGDRWYEGLLAAVAALEQMPRRHGFAREQSAVAFELRQFVHRPYRVLFTVSGNTVRLLHVRHVAMDNLRPEELGR
jgi:hypothetical protein